ncbi:MAG: branched-chain amino acid ABC transporter permease [Peptococcaceae bacterium]|nr:branched-chain amino acid ABC transporter permease [Peptococcaceae bacterium]
MIFFIAIVILIALLIPNPYYLGNFVIIGIFTIVVVGLCLLMGYTGQVSLGHAAFYGLGAYSSALLTAKVGFTPLLAMVIAAVITGIVAFLIGIATLRLKEHYLALATLGSGIIIYIFFNEQVNITGGPSGFSGIPYFSFGSWQFDTERSYYFLVWSFVLLAIIFARNIVSSRIGRALRAIHTSEIAATCMGIPAFQYKVQIFVISAIYASIAGSLYAHYITFMSPSPFGFQASVEFVLMAAIGGLASIWGPLFGVTAVLFLTEFLKTVVPEIMPSAGGEYEIIFFGLILVIVMIFMPEGLVGGIKDYFAKGKIKKLAIKVNQDLAEFPENDLPSDRNKGVQ